MRSMRFCCRRLLALGMGLLLAGPQVHAQQVDFRVPFAPADGWAVNGVEVDYKLEGIDSTAAYVGSYGPGQLTHVQDPSLTGDAAGTLSLTFARPTSRLAFGLALNTAAALEPGALVVLQAPGGEVIQRSSLDTRVLGGGTDFSEAHFSYQGPPVARAAIEFADGPTQFALDNLDYVIPEPGSGILGVLALLILRWRRRWR